MRLSLLESDAETADFGFETGDMAHRPHGHTSEIVSAAARFRQLASVTVGSAFFAALFGSLAARSVRVCHRGYDAGGQEA